MSGWIKTHRSIKEHWLYEPNRPRTYREAWEDILLNVNWEKKKVLINGKLIICDKGQSLNSINTWASIFNWSYAKVRHFFRLLENDEMITTQGMQYTTMLTVCNWDIYQSDTTSEKQTEDKTDRTTKDKRKTTTKEYKEDKEIKEVYIWRENFEVYLEDLRKSFKEILTKEYISERQEFHPNLDIKKTIEKSCKDFWATKEGWNNKKKSKSKTINWRMTFNNALTQKMNQVYKDRYNQDSKLNLKIRKNNEW